jgi:adenine-specific DNA methylase
MNLRFWRKPKMNEEAEFLRLVIRTVSYGRELNLRPPSKRDDEVIERANHTLRSLLKMVNNESTTP